MGHAFAVLIATFFSKVTMHLLFALAYVPSAVQSKARKTLSTKFGVAAAGSGLRLVVNLAIIPQSSTVPKTVLAASHDHPISANGTHNRRDQRIDTTD